LRGGAGEKKILQFAIKEKKKTNLKKVGHGRTKDGEVFINANATSGQKEETGEKKRKNSKTKKCHQQESVPTETGGKKRISLGKNGTRNTVQGQVRKKKPKEKSKKKKGKKRSLGSDPEGEIHSKKD